MSEDSLLNISNNTYKNSPEERQKFEPHFSKLTDAKTSSCFQSIPSSHTADISNLAESMLKRYTNFVVIGIGGSSMGGRALVEMTGAQHIRFLDNIDSKEFSDLWTEVSIDQHQLKKTAWIVISKSGSSIEILWNYNFIHDLYSENGLNLIEQSFFISEIKDNPLSRLARQHQRPLLEIPEVVGGRFSVLTPVGLLIAALCGWNIDDMVSGAHDARKNKDLILQSCVLFNQALQEKKPMTLFWFYHSRFRWFGGWLQQLWAESLGKKINRSGQPAPAFSTPVIAIGACDQHSILQQVVDGPKDKLVCIFRFQDVEKSSHQLKTPLFKEIDFLRHRPYGELIQAEAIATQQGLSESGVSSELFTMQSTDARGLGFLFMYFQLVVATLGESADINSFDQPGVALGKKITLSILQQN